MCSGLLSPIMAAFQQGPLSMEEDAFEMASKERRVGYMEVGLSWTGTRWPEDVG